ncbi:hypothetical protein P5673_024474, partial [Acropora cervicornis]
MSTSSGRKRIYDSNATKCNVRNQHHTRVWLDSVIYSSWISAKSMCSHSSHSKFAGHLLSLEQRRRSMQVDITGVSAVEDLQFLADTLYRILDGSVMVSRSSSVSSRSSVEESEDELSFTLKDVQLDEALCELNHHKDLDEIESGSKEEQSL